MFADFGVVNFWTYLLGATLIVLVPGPETMFVIKTSITSGIKRGFAAIFSILLSDVILVLLAWCGLAAVISSTPALFNAIKYAGAAYLFYLGVQTIRAIFKPIVDTSEEKKSSTDAGDHWTRNAGYSTESKDAAVLYFFLRPVHQCSG